MPTTTYMPFLAIINTLVVSCSINKLNGYKRKIERIKMKVNIKKLSPTAKIPTKGTYASAGYDLYVDIRSDEDDIGVVTIYPHQTLMIPTGISVEIPNGYFGGIFARSGL